MIIPNDMKSRFLHTTRKLLLISKVIMLAWVFKCTHALGQCPTGTVSLQSQAAIDGFIIQYPNCTELDRLDVTLGADIVNVNGLRNLIKINGDLNITHNPLLTDLSGFNKIKSTGYLWIANNSSLAAIDAFNQLETTAWFYIGGNNALQSIGGFDALIKTNNFTITNHPELTSITSPLRLNQVAGAMQITNNAKLDQISIFEDLTRVNIMFSIQNNPSLTDLNAFNKLTLIGGGAFIKDNSSLVNMDGLSLLTRVDGDLLIENNARLKDISGLINIAASSISGSGLTIKDNPLVSVCDLPNFCEYLQTTRPRNITGNAGRCITEQAVSDACSTDLDGEYCSNAIDINTLFGHPVNEPQSSGTYSTEGYDALNDPDFGQECLFGHESIWFKFIGDSHRYAIRSTDCGSKVYSDPNGAMYSGDCSNLAAIKCHTAISWSDENPDQNFEIILETVSGEEYYLMVDAYSTDNFIDQFTYGEFCLRVTKLEPICTVTIPDPNFKTYLVGNTAINTNGDSEIQCSEAEAFNGTINCPSLGITDLTGVEAFTSLTGLDCSKNSLSAIDISKNTALASLNCNENQLTNLDVSKNTGLKDIFCAINLLKSLNTSANPALTFLSAGGNQLTSLDLKNNKELDFLACHLNDIVSLDLSGNPKLKDLFGSGNNNLTSLNLANGNNPQFSYINVTNCPALTCIRVDNRTYSETNWVGANFQFDPQHSFSEDCGADLDGEYCSNAIDIQSLFGHPVNEPQNSGTYSSEGYNALNDPDFGNECLSENVTIWFKFTGDGYRYSVRSRDCSAKIYTNPNGAMYSGDCSDLTSIRCHRDIWTGDVDPDINFKINIQTVVGEEYFLVVEVESTNDFINFFNYGDFCLEVTKIEPECVVTIPDPNFKTYLLENFEINTNGDEKIQCEEAESFFGMIDCPNLNISDLTGIEAFLYITGLNCSGNRLSSIDISKNTRLGQLNCSENNLTTLNAGNNTDLWSLQCADNQLSSLDISEIPWLEELECSNNQIAVLDISGNVKISYLSCNDNALRSLNLANGSNETMSAINAGANPDLICIKVDNKAFSDENWRSGNFKFDNHHVFDEICETCNYQEKEIFARFLVSSTACTGDALRFIDYSTGELANDIGFSWDFGDGETSTERDPVYTYAVSGQYTVTLRLVVPTCDPLVLTKEIQILGCLKPGSENGKYTSVFPNPTTGALKINADLPASGDALIHIFDAQGKNIIIKNISNVQKLNEELVIPQKGMYFIEVRHLFGAEHFKVLVIE